MKLVIAALLDGSVAAFAPARVGKANSSLNAFDSELGVQAPLGFFDPLGMLEDVDQERFDRLRYVEVKHGRICQLAFLVQIVTHGGTHLPGDINFSGHSVDSFPNGISAVIGPNAIPLLGISQIFGFVGFLELFVMKDSANGGEPGEFPVDFRNGAIDLVWGILSDEVKLQKHGIELNNGRAAMMGILGLMVQEKIGETLISVDGKTAAVDLPIISYLN